MKSIILGYPGKYNLLGVNVCFENGTPGFSAAPHLHQLPLITALAKSCIENSCFCILTFSSLHIFSHEMSHALAGRMFSSATPTVFIYQQAGETKQFGSFTPWQTTIVSTAGPMGDIAFSFCQLITIIALRNILPRPLSVIFAGGAFLWIVGELLYAYGSANNKTDGDFGEIAKMGRTYLAAASTALITELILVISLIFKMLRAR